jgi:hypothetical protein
VNLSFNNHKTQIIVAIIGFLGIILAAIIGRVSFPEPTPNSVCPEGSEKFTLASREKLAKYPENNTDFCNKYSGKTICTIIQDRKFYCKNSVFVSWPNE